MVHADRNTIPWTYRSMLYIYIYTHTTLAVVSMMVDADRDTIYHGPIGRCYIHYTCRSVCNGPWPNQGRSARQMTAPVYIMKGFLRGTFCCRCCSFEVLLLCACSSPRLDTRDPLWWRTIKGLSDCRTCFKQSCLWRGGTGGDGDRRRSARGMGRGGGVGNSTLLHIVTTRIISSFRWAAMRAILTPSLPWCHLKTTKKSTKFETLKVKVQGFELCKMTIEMIDKWVTSFRFNE